MPPKLYSYVKSGNGYKVRLLASLLSIELDIYEIDYLRHEHHSEWYMEINPRGEVPSLVTEDGLTFTDSASILSYLASTNPDEQGKGYLNSYWGADGKQQAQIVEWLAFAAGWIDSGLCEARAILLHRNPTGTLDAQGKESLEKAQSLGYKSLDLLNKRLDKRQWLAADRPTVADVAVFPYVALAPFGQVSLDAYPNVLRWIEDIRGLKGFISMPRLDEALNMLST